MTGPRLGISKLVRKYIPENNIKYQHLKKLTRLIISWQDWIEEGSSGKKEGREGSSEEGDGAHGIKKIKVYFLLKKINCS